MGKGHRRRENRASAETSKSVLVSFPKAILASPVAFAKGAFAWVRELASTHTKLVRLAVAGIILLGGAAIALRLYNVPAEQPVEFELKADQGRSSFSIAAENDAVSPGCGCPEPELGEQHWQGMSVPSTGFDLDVKADSSDEIADGLWSLTAFAPDTGPMDWYGAPNRAVSLLVFAIHPNGLASTLFEGPVSHLVAWTDRDVSVKQRRINPYAAILPAAGGKTSFSSHEPSRVQWRTQVDVTSTSPQRPAVTLEEKYQKPEVLQRGPMVDLLGPTLELTIPYTKRTRIWTAAKPLRGARPGDRVTLVVITPFALRLIPHPVQKDWQKEFAGLDSKGAENPLGEVPITGRDAFKDPLAEDRILLKEALPEYDVQISHIKAPSREAWTSFANRSEKHELIWPMMRKTRLDPLIDPSYLRSEYALPPVTTRPQIGVFGRIKKFESTSVGGQAVVGSDTHSIPRGQKLEFSSDSGLTAGAYRLTPLVSSGQETAQASISGAAKVWIGGDLISHPDWLPWIPFSAILGAVLGVVATEIYHRWMREDSTEWDDE